MDLSRDKKQFGRFTNPEPVTGQPDVAPKTGHFPIGDNTTGTADAILQAFESEV
jgi:hypothetical protein